MLAATLVVLAVAAFLVALGYVGAQIALSGGEKVPLETRPERFGLPYEAVEFRTRDGVRLRGWFIPAAAPSQRTILFCHGWGTNKGEVLRDTHRVRDGGFNLFYFDFRCCGESDGRLLSVGVLEAMDFDAAVGFLAARRPGDSLAVYGISMGAMVAFGGLTRHPGFKAAVLESPFASHNQALARYARVRYHVPYYPLMPFIFYWVERRLGVDPETTSPAGLAGRLGNTPCLAIYGDKDPLATPAIGRSLMALVPGPTDFWIVPDAGHGKCSETAGAAYPERLARFYSEHLS